MTYAQSTDRNRGFISLAAQGSLAELTVAVAGAGGDGGQVAITLARLGVRRFRLADPETFEVENLNRQAGCTTATIGQNKAEVVGGIISAIDPEADVKVFTDGINDNNLVDFLDDVDLIVDETDYSIPHLGMMLAEGARARSIPLVTVLNIGFGSVFAAFLPDGLTFEAFIGSDKRDAVGSDIPLWRWVPRLPVYADAKALGPVQRGERPAPSVAPGVQLGAAHIATEVVRWVETGRFRVVAPRVTAIDLMDGKVRTIRFRRIHWYRSLGRLVLRNVSRRNGD